MALLALVFFALYFAFAFGARPVLQLRRTGSSGSTRLWLVVGGPRWRFGDAARDTLARPGDLRGRSGRGRGRGRMPANYTVGYVEGPVLEGIRRPSAWTNPPCC